MDVFDRGNFCSPSYQTLAFAVSILNTAYLPIPLLLLPILSYAHMCVLSLIWGTKCLRESAKGKRGLFGLMVQFAS